MTMKIKKIMIVSMLLLSIIMIGAVSASDDIADDTVSLDEDNNDEISIEENEDEISAQDSEVLEKTNEEALSVARTYDVYDFNAFHTALTSGDYDQVTINIRADFKLTSDTDVSESIAKVIINGNGKTVNGDSKYQFLFTKGSLVLNNLKMINCKGAIGGAVNTWGDDSSITNCVFSNCQAYDSVPSYLLWGRDVDITAYGGAIYAAGDRITISHNTFENNKAITGSPQYEKSQQYIRGGAIYNYGDDCTISNNIFRGNSANYDKITCRGGAVYNYGDNVKITGNLFYNNNADYGGAVYNVGHRVTFSNNKFNYNTADNMGSAIYTNGDNVVIDSNNFKGNKLNGGSSTQVIYNSKSNGVLSNNRLVSTSASTFGTIGSYGDDATIKNNVFDDRHDTTITVNKNVGYGDYIIISVKDDQGNPVSGAKVNVNIGKSKTYTTDKNGQIKISTDNLKLKKYGLKASFAGNGGNLGSSVNVKVSVKKGTPKIVAKNKKFKKSASKKYQIKITSKTGKAIKKMKVTLKINGKSYKATTNKKSDL